LEKEKQPLHWNEIAKRALKYGRKEIFNSTGLYNALIAHKDLFVRVGQGIYGLSDWGYEEVSTYVDIIASVLKKEEKAMSIGKIYTNVCEQRQIKRSSLIMYLYLHPRFYRSVNKMYGLRAWLPPREKQSLLTPKWLVEDIKSFERVDGARKRGYIVENIILQDNK
jgi:hypothetical protein